jgi:hypothetical protein
MKWLIVLFFCFLLVSRFWNIGSSARFTRDESSDISRMHEYWSAKKITLVGPISNDNVKVFGSLTYYMLMPFAVLGNFSAQSPAYGTAFYGVLTGLLLWLLIIRNNRSRLVASIASVLLVTSYPLIESSRWAWNPHLMLFWILLGVWLATLKRPIFLFLAAIALGLSVHTHYVAFVPATVYLGVLLFNEFKKRNWNRVSLLLVGFGLSLSPFIIFDLRHPPGLFLSVYLGGATPNIDVDSQSLNVVQKLLNSVFMFGYTLIRNQNIANLLLFFSACLLITDLIKKRWRSVIIFMPTLAMVVFMIWLDNPHTRYFLATVGFYYLWLLDGRSGFKSKIFQGITIIILFVGSLICLPKSYHAEYQPPAGTVNAISDTVQSILLSHPEIKNSNIATDASVDSDLLATKYRDYLSVRGISFKAASEYDTSENLFLISQGSIEDLKRSQSFPLLIFCNQKLRDTVDVPNTNWKVFWFSY